MTTVSLTSPANAGTRDLVRAWLSVALPPDISGLLVEVDCGPLRAPSTSFVDELLKIVVVERGASLLRLTNASDRARALALRSAQNFDIVDRVEMPVIAPVKRGRHLTRLSPLRPRLSR